MFMIILALLIIVASIFGSKIIRSRFEYSAIHHYATDSDSASKVKRRGALIGHGVMALGMGTAIFLLGMTSWVSVGKHETAHLTKIYGTSSLPTGQIIAVNGEKGPQAEILGPGFHISPLIRVINEIDYSQVISVPEGKYGFLTARDGQPLRADQFIADAWPKGKDMLNATVFLKNGGQKGPQLNVLTPGVYRVNGYLWEVTLHDATNIPEGHVGVIKSNVQGPVDYGNLTTDRPDACWQKKVTAAPEDGNEPQIEALPEEGRLTAVLVPVGCIGVWEQSLNPGRYYINKAAYQTKVIETRVNTWEYKGGYDFRQIDLSIDDEGKITQKASSTHRNIPETAADRAVFARVEGWVVPVELRALVQVTPENAPFVVASVGGLNEIENRIMTPVIRSVVRNVLGEEGRTVLALIGDRSQLEEDIEQVIVPEGLKAGVLIKEIRIGDPAIPPELLVSRLREQLATQLEKTFKQEQIAQTARIKRERERATADQQPEFVQSEIRVKVATNDKESARLRGEGVRLELTEVAAGQKEQALVLGEDRVLTITLVKEVLQTLKDKPELVNLVSKLVPSTVVTGSNGLDLAAAAAVLRGLPNADESPKISTSRSNEGIVVGR